jgi:uncharacterized membrane protein
MLIFHIIAGTLALIAGSFALFSRKGVKLHRSAGNVFFVSMLIVALSAMALAVIIKQEFPFIPILIFYLVATSWATVKRPAKKTGRFELAACLLILAIALGMFMQGLDPANNEHGSNESGLYFFFGSVAALAGLLDINMIIRGGLAGAHRIARHLWRMCFAMTGAMASFLAQEQVIPKFLVNSNLLWLPILLMLVLMLFWLIRVVFFKKTSYGDKIIIDNTSS